MEENVKYPWTIDDSSSYYAFRCFNFIEYFYHFKIGFYSELLTVLGRLGRVLSRVFCTSFIFLTNYFYRC